MTLSEDGFNMKTRIHLKFIETLKKPEKYVHILANLLLP